MDLNNSLTNIRNPQSNTFKIAIGIIILIILILIWRYKVNKAHWDKLNPVFFKKGTGAKKYHKIKPEKFYESPYGTEFTWFFWMYVDNMVHNYGKWKHVFTKGNKGYYGHNQSPGVWIYPKKNALRFIVTTNKKNDYLYIDDFPIRKWFSIGLIARGTEFEIYMDGKLKITRNLSAKIKTNTGFLHLCQNGGFGGNMASISYYPSAKSPRFMEVKQSKGPFDERLWEKIWNYISGKAMALKGSIKIDLDVDLDIPIYTENSNSSCSGKMVRDVGPISLDKAKELCNKDPRCNCLTRMDKKFGNVSKGNFRLEENSKSGARFNKRKGTKHSGYFTSFTKFRTSDLKQKKSKKNKPPKI